MHTDSELLRRYVEQGDERSFAELVERHLGVVFNAALRRVNGNRHLAEEATQLVFTQMAAKAPRLVHHAAVLGWLHTSTRYAASVLIRREQRLAARHHTAAAMDVQDENSPDWEAIRPLIDEALDRLGKSHRQALLLRYFSGRSFAEIGADLNVSENAARKCVDRAVENLRRQFARRGITTSASALALALSAAPAHAAPVPTASTVATTAIANIGAAAGVSIGDVIAFMTASKLVTPGIFVAAILALTGIGTGVVAWSQQQDQEWRQLNALNAQAQALKSRLARLNREARASAPATKFAASDADKATNTQAQWLQAAYQQDYLLATDPAFAPIRNEQYRLRFLHEYGAFLSTRNYPPQKIEALRQAAMDRYQSFYVHRAEALLDPAKLKQHNDTVATDDRAFFEHLKQSFTDAEQSDIRRCFESQRMMPVATTIGQSLEFDGAPLDRVQELALAMIIADAESASHNASPEQRKQLATADAATGLSVADRQLLDDASAFLTPDQLRLYEGYLRLENVRAETMRRARVLYNQSHS